MEAADVIMCIDKKYNNLLKVTKKTLSSLLEE